MTPSSCCFLAGLKRAICHGAVWNCCGIDPKEVKSLSWGKHAYFKAAQSVWLTKHDSSFGCCTLLLYPLALHSCFLLINLHSVCIAVSLVHFIPTLSSSCLCVIEVHLGGLVWAVTDLKMLLSSCWAPGVPSEIELSFSFTYHLMQCGVLWLLSYSFKGWWGGRGGGDCIKTGAESWSRTKPRLQAGPLVCLTER